MTGLVPKFLYPLTLVPFLFMEGTFEMQLAAALTVFYLLRLFFALNHRIAFREFVLAIYSVNYLLSPVISYIGNKHTNNYGMKIPAEEYLSVAIPSILALHVGVYLIPSRIFTIDFDKIRLQSYLNQRVLKQMLFAGIAFRLLSPYAPGELAFFTYLLSGIRFVAAFGLFILDPRRFRWYWIAPLAMELLLGIRAAMFHDAFMWILFFAIMVCYQFKPRIWTKLAVVAGFAFIYLVLQNVKGAYRQMTWDGGQEASISTFANAISTNLNDGGVYNNKNEDNYLDRLNQGWILASTIDNMEHTQDYQGMNLMSRYMEAALLPRVLAPDKLQAGDKEIFNRFSGHYISSGTSMGLGIIADGFISYRHEGSIIFTFLLGLLFCMVFKIVERWSETSTFFVLLIFPILNYAVRPDCETQTTLGQIIKGCIAFGLVTIYYDRYFKRQRLILENEHGSVELMQA